MKESNVELHSRIPMGITSSKYASIFKNLIIDKTSFLDYLRRNKMKTILITTTCLVYIIFIYISSTLEFDDPVFPDFDYFCVRNGKWVFENKTRYEDMLSLSRKNAKFRKDKNWPAKLFNDDLTCGIKHSYKVNKYTVRTQCNGLGLYPCCNEDFGKCGKGPKYCLCKNCIDYSKEIYPEYYKWTSSKQHCNKKMPSQKQSCAFLNKHFTSVTFIGDSLCRHLYEGFLLHLTNDSNYGALFYNTNESIMKKCSFENQFNEAFCRSHIATNWEDVKRNKKYCKQERKPIKVQFFSYISSRYKKEILNLVRELTKESRPLIIFGLGGHMSFDYKLLIHEVLQPVVELVQSTSKSKPLIMFHNIMAIGPLKYLEFIHKQGTERIKKFNKNIHRFCQKNDIIVFDPYLLTRHVYSFDGTHYGLHLNIEKVKLMLNGMMNHPTIVNNML